MEFDVLNILLYLAVILIATKLTGEELVNSAFELNFDETGWYSIIIRNQERSRIFTTFFISSIAR